MTDRRFSAAERAGEVSFYLAFGATYPLFLTAEVFQRRRTRVVERR